MPAKVPQRRIAVQLDVADVLAELETETIATALNGRGAGIVLDMDLLHAAAADLAVGCTGDALIVLARLLGRRFDGLADIGAELAAARTRIRDLEREVRTLQSEAEGV